MLLLFGLVFRPSLKTANSIFDTQLIPVLAAKDVAEQTSYNSQAGLNPIKKLFVTDDNGLDQRFSMGEPRSSRGQYFVYPLHRIKLEIFLTTCFFILYEHP